jgi:exodeoxyribonuclease V alpha subunit
MSVDLPALAALGALSELDLHFARALSRIGSEDDPQVLLAAALCSRKVQEGHVCLDLPRLCSEERTLEVEGQRIAIDWPDPAAWLAALRASRLVGGEHGAGKQPTPLQLDARGRLYLQRYYEHEQSLAQSILERARGRAPAVHEPTLRAGLDRLFGVPPKKSAKPRAQLELFAVAAPEDSEPDRQRQAAERAARRAFCVISGGPGTGKTATVVKILALLVEQAVTQGRPPPRTLLLAPTGKAAARLSESIKRAKAGLAGRPEITAAIADQASTIHRALGASALPGPRFRHHRDAPLAADVVVVDEASMVDLALMARLFEAVPPAARMILLGDKDQLASVEAGAVLGDICGAGLADAPPDAAIAPCIALLTRSYRYGEHSGIRELAAAIQGAQPARVLEVLRDGARDDVRLVTPAPDDRRDGRDGLPRELLDATTLGFTPLLEARDPVSATAAIDRVRVLCAHRRGPFGQLRINAAIESALRKAGVIAVSGERYPGRPLMVTQNDYQTRLFNGEVGVLQRDAHGRLLAHFADDAQRPRAVALARLPRHETAYALSVHKSQGSEFDEVLLFLPPEPSPLLSRELLYTAVTRARKRVVVFGSAEVLSFAVQRSVPRASGLRDALWGPR